MPRRSPFKHPRFPREASLCALRWNLRPAKPALNGAETRRPIQHGYIHRKQLGVFAKIQSTARLFEAA